jgi:hypothetical protein
MSASLLLASSFMVAGSTQIIADWSPIVYSGDRALARLGHIFHGWTTAGSNRSGVPVVELAMVRRARPEAAALAPSAIPKAIHQKYDWRPQAVPMQIVCRNAGRLFPVTRATSLRSAITFDF